MTSISELLSQDVWSRLAAAGYVVAGVLLLIRAIVVPAHIPVGNAYQVVRTVARYLVAITLTVIGMFWVWRVIDPGVDRALWSEGLTPYSTFFPYLFAILPTLDLRAWVQVRRVLP